MEVLLHGVLMRLKALALVFQHTRLGTVRQDPGHQRPNEEFGGRIEVATHPGRRQRSEMQGVFVISTMPIIPITNLYK